MTRLLWISGMVLAALALLLVVLLLLLSADRETIWAVAWGGGLFTLNMVLDTLFLIKSMKKDADSFVRQFFSGKLVRVVIVLMIFFTIWVFAALNRFIFVVTFFILYFLFQIMEIYILHKHNSKRF